MRSLVTALALVASVGCSELGVVGDGTSVSYGKVSKGWLVDGARIPDKGEGFMTRWVWTNRGNRFGTDELVDLLVGVARRRYARDHDVKLVIGDLSMRGGGPATLWHMSHQSGRDVDLCFFMKDAAGKPFDADGMYQFYDPDPKAPMGKIVARNGSGTTLDVPRMWSTIKELITAPEATVQFIFIFDPIKARILEYAKSIEEPEAIIARASKALVQPGAARHDDHFHVRIYCSPDDKTVGCVDFGPKELLEEREEELAATGGALLAALGGALPAPTSGIPAPPKPHGVAEAALEGVLSSGATTPHPDAAALKALGRLVHAHMDRIELGRWR